MFIIKSMSHYQLTDAGGITELDIKLAKEMDKTAKSIKPILVLF